MKKIVVLLLIVSMFVSVAGCAKKVETKTEVAPTEAGVEEATAAESATNESSSADLSFPLKETQTLNILTQSSQLAPEDPNDKLVWSRFEKDTNVHINWTNYTWDVFKEKRNLAIASGDLPDAIFDAALLDYDILNFAKNGVIIPVEDLIDQYMPNLKAIYDKYPQYRQFVTSPDGHIYTFPWIEELGAGKTSIHSIDCIPWINQSWLDNLGLKMPTTIDELTTVLRAFKEEDANGNGDPDDEIPMSFKISADGSTVLSAGGEDFVSLLGAFGFGDNPDHTVVDNDGKVIFTANQEGYKEGIKWFSQLYSEGLIDTEIFTQDWNTYLAKGSEQKYGLYFTWDMGNITGFTSGDYSTPDEIVADYAPMPALAGPNGEKNITRTNNFGLDRGRMVITSSNKNLELTARWIDKCYEPLQSAQNNWGTYGDDELQNIFELNEAGDFLKHLPLNGTSPWELRQKTFVGGPLAILDEHYDKYITCPDDALWRLNVIKDVYVKDMNMENNFPKVFYSVEDQQTLTNIETVMFEYVLTKRAEWIENGKIDKEWDDYLEELDSMSVNEWLTIKQTYYDNYTK